MKRVFTDADIYEDEWYQDLSKELKLLWDYICRRAEYGFWKPNWGLVTFQLKITVDPEEALKAFNTEDNKEKNRVIVQPNGRWFIPSWVPFQYKNLSQDCKAHKPVFDYYKTHYFDLFNSYLIAIGYQQEKEKDKDKEKVKETEKEKKGIVKGENPEKQTDELPPREKWFDEIWQKYPVKDGKKHAKRHFFASVKTADDYARISAALESYLGSKRVKEGFIKNASTWFNGWEDWINYQDPVKQETDAEKADRLIANMRAAKYAKSV